jgi:hypothetical protein
VDKEKVIIIIGCPLFECKPCDIPCFAPLIPKAAAGFPKAVRKIFLYVDKNNINVI